MQRVHKFVVSCIPIVYC